MKEKNKVASKGLLYSDKFLLIFSIVVAVVFWGVVKVNYSEKISKNFSDITVTFDNILKDTDYVPYISDDVAVTVTVSGKSYNVGNTSLSKDSIIVEPVNTFVDSTGYKYVSLSARFVDNAASSGVEITKVTPSSIKVYFDREATDSFNVVAKLSNKLSSLVEGDYVVGQPVPSVNVMEITGPATVINSISEVYFEATVDQADIPLTLSKELPATISFGLESEELNSFLTYEAFDEQKNPATVNIPVYVTKDVPTEVKFVGQPAMYSDTSPSYSVSPSKVSVTYNPQDIQQIESFSVGTIDFRTLDNKVNKFTYTVDETMSTSLVDKELKEFTVSVDMSKMSSMTLETVPSKVVISGKAEGYNYSAKINEASFLDKIKIIGPSESLANITVDDIQIEINVSDIDVENEQMKVLEITNISIPSADIDDCWVYGSCNATVTVTEE